MYMKGPYDVIDEDQVAHTRNRELRNQDYICAISGSLEMVLSVVKNVVETTHGEPEDIIILRGDIAFDRGVKWNIDPKRWYLYYTRNERLY